MEELFKAAGIDTIYFSALGSLCGLGYIVFVKNGRMGFKGWERRLGWPVVAIVTVMGLFTVVDSIWDD
jgi:hypothetical protein